MQKRSRIILDKSRWHALKEDSGKAVVLGTQGQPLGQTVSRTRYRWSAKQTGTRSQANNGLIGRGSCKTCHRERPAQCHEGQGEMAAGNRQRRRVATRTGLFISLGARFGRIRRNDQRDTLAAALRL